MNVIHRVIGIVGLYVPNASEHCGTCSRFSIVSDYWWRAAIGLWGWGGESADGFHKSSLALSSTCSKFVFRVFYKQPSGLCFSTETVKRAVHEDPLMHHDMVKMSE